MERFAAALYGFAVISQRPLLLEADYWALAKCQAGWRVEFAFATADRDWSRFAATLFGCAAGADFVAYQDAAAGQQRFAHLANGRLAGALFLAPEPVAVSRDWAIEQLGADLASQRARVAVVAGRPGRGLAERGATVCSCFGVGANQIADAAKAGCVTVEAIGQALQAGTNCGSCRAEIKGIINAYRLRAAECVNRHGIRTPFSG
jgi:assimilatory nitrate reductase catalytic subunit